MRKKITLEPVKVKTIAISNKSSVVRVNDGGYTWVG
jgi:hypothetical protein